MLRRTTITLVVAAAVAAISSCIAPVRVKPQVIAPGGESAAPDLAVAKPGTPRVQIHEKLQTVEVPTGDSHLLWARWSDSSTALVMFGGGPGGAAATGMRVWRRRNLLFTFDDSGQLLTTENKTDAEVLAALSAAISRRPPLLEPQVSFEVRHFHADSDRPGRVTLSKTSFQFAENLNSKHDFTAPWNDVSAVVLGRGSRLPRTDAGGIPITVVFGRRNAAGTRLGVRLDADDVYSLIAYFDQAHRVQPHS